MADNVELNAASGGAILATDDVTGVQFQKIKIDVGGDGVSAPLSNSNPIPISDSGGSLTVDNAGTFATQAAQSGAWNITNITGTVSLPTGAATAAKQPALGTAGSASADVLSVQGIASMTALKVDGSGVTQPVSAAALPLPTGASTAAKQPALGTAGSASTDVITIQGIASMTKLLVTPDSVALPANQSVNVAQLAGTTTDTNSGVKSAGTLRVVLATDQPQLTNKLLVTPDANSAINLAQIAATSTAVNNGTASAGCQRVTIASDNTAFTVNAAQSGTWTVQPGNTANSTPWLVTDTPATSGGLSSNYQIAPATPAKTAVKASAGQIFAIKASNNNASPRYLKLFNVASAGVTLGSTACDDQFEIPGNTAGAGFVINIDKGIAFGTAITAAITGGIASADNTSISANEVIVAIYYK